MLRTVFPDSTFAFSDQRKAPYSSTQRATLETVAAACPYDYGPGVYMARAMLSKADTAVYTGINDCEKGPAASSGKWAGEEEDDEETPIERATEYAFNLYPNPNAGNFIVNLNLGETELAEMQVWNISGQRITIQQLNNGENSLSLNVANGLYLYVVMVNGKAQWTGKISVLSQ